MKILITGGTGLVGRYLSEITESEKPVVLSRKECNITDFFSVRTIFYQIKPDVVFHLAAFTNVDLSENDPVSAFRVNVSGTNNIAFFAEKINAHLVYLSTDFVFDGMQKQPYKEQDVPHPLSIYGKTKFEGERIVSSMCSKYTIVRSSRIFGKNGNNFASALPGKLLSGEKTIVTTDLVNSPTYAKDLATALFEIAKKQSYGLLHFCNSGFCNWHEYALYICNHLRIDTSLLVPVSIKHFHQSIAERPRFSALDTTLFSKNFYQPRPWQKALEEYLEHEVLKRNTNMIMKQ
ncbi:MAG TPA: dTDP-4-dehydrorhamnose reductase [bacterium]|nr:dTDP-4-dehydrorhamnose reductase [bacterium]HOL34320.1 dTDP-4-dehydrorhamnose reductase [bacterium]HPP08018.1 dTDP-4-dehydrorhamnose reductase [bacterium]